LQSLHLLDLLRDALREDDVPALELAVQLGELPLLLAGPEEVPDPCTQLRLDERFPQVVVGTRLERLDPSGRAGACGQEEDG
jgi:hypothetical protein